MRYARIIIICDRTRAVYYWLERMQNIALEACIWQERAIDVRCFILRACVFPVALVCEEIIRP